MFSGPNGGLCPVTDFQFAKDFTQPIPDCLFAQAELCRNLFVAQPLREQSQDVALSVSKRNLGIRGVEVIGSWFGACHGEPPS